MPAQFSELCDILLNPRARLTQLPNPTPIQPPTMTTAKTTSSEPTSTMPPTQTFTRTHSEPGWHPNHTRATSVTSSSSASLSSGTSTSDSSDTTPDIDISNYPNGKMSLSGISLRAMLLGTTLGLTSSLTLLLATTHRTPLWRMPFFIAALSLFHFLEFFVTARYNTRYATVSSFLLSSNGWAYNVAHGSAVVECLLSHLLWPGQSRLARMLSVSEPFFGGEVSLLLVGGLVLLVIGQVVRTIAMAQAGGNFNHHVQSRHQEGHVLVKSGLYRFLRHPSYFGFFWWGLGTQLVLGNVVCFVGYALVLWRFFSSRIKREEAYLISFFGDAYVQYRKDTPVGIPGI